MIRFLPSSPRMAARYFGGRTTPPEWTLDSPLLPWAPTPLVDPLVLTATTSSAIDITPEDPIPDDRDVLIVMPNAITNRNITLRGGRHIRMIGGHMGTGRFAAYNFTGSLFMEGVVCDLTTRITEGDAMQIGGKRALPVRPWCDVQNVRLLGIHGTNLSWDPTTVTCTLTRTNGNSEAVLTTNLAHRCAKGERIRLSGGSQPSMKGVYTFYDLIDANTIAVRDHFNDSLAAYSTLTGTGMTGWRFNVYENDGAPVNIVSIVRNGSGTTITTATPHGMTVGKRGVVSGATALNETYWARSIVSSTAFTVNDYSNSVAVTGSDFTATGGTLQKTRVDSGNHADGIQPQNDMPIGDMRMCNVTIDSNYQAVILGNSLVDPSGNPSGNTALYMYKVNMRHNAIEPQDASAYLLYLKDLESRNGACPCDLREVYITEKTENGYRFRAEQFGVKPWEGYLGPDGADWGAILSEDGTSISWAPAAGITGIVKIGEPVDGDFAPAPDVTGQGGLGVPGWGYVSPGYFGG